MKRTYTLDHTEANIIHHIHVPIHVHDPQSPFFSFQVSVYFRGREGFGNKAMSKLLNLKFTGGLVLSRIARWKVVFLFTLKEDIPVRILVFMNGSFKLTFRSPREPTEVL